IDYGMIVERGSMFKEGVISSSRYVVSRSITCSPEVCSNGSISRT
ncbi:721_t:CDS:1, partial [Scutellospora calospora]